MRFTGGPLPRKMRRSRERSAGQRPMTLRLVSSGNNAALVIRDHLVPRVRQRGTLPVQRGAAHPVVLRNGALTIEHWTPFNELSNDEAASPGYRHALAHQHTLPDPPYGLDVWHGGDLVMRLRWSDDGAVALVAFARGAWEAEVLAL